MPFIDASRILLTGDLCRERVCEVQRIPFPQTYLPQWFTCRKMLFLADTKH